MNSVPDQFTVISHNWIELQQVVQGLYIDNPATDLHSEALAQRITRVGFDVFL